MRCVNILSTSFLVLVGLRDVLATSPEGKGFESFQQNVEYSGCVLPEQPIGGKFEIDSCTGSSCNATSGDKVASGTFIALRCHKGYAVKGNKLTACRRDEWYLPPTCVKTCPPLTSRSVDIVYEYQCNGLSRDSIIFPGTKATLKCKSFFEIQYSNEPGYRSVTCLESGEWDRPLFDCTPECGKAGDEANPLVVGGYETKDAEFPWHVGIYRKRNEDEWTQICGGTLVKPNLVVSAAHCFVDKNSMQVLKVSQFAVAAGKKNRSYYQCELSAQRSSVKEIHKKDKYYGNAGNYALDIALIRTKSSFVYTASVRPICIDESNKFENNYPWPGRIGQVSGWGITDDGDSSNILRKIKLPYIPHQECIDSVPDDFKASVSVNDKFCAGYLNGSSVCPGDSGGGLCFKYNGLWYLSGIVSVGPHSPSVDVFCESNYYTVFTNVSEHLEWIRGFLVGSEAERRTSCVLPEKPLHGGYKLDSCSELHVSVPGGEVPNGGSLVYSCDERYSLKGSTDSTCNDGVWSMPPPICARIRCQPLEVPNTVNVVCMFKGDTVPCESEMDAGTQATVTCSRFYKISGYHNSTHRDIICNEDGKWDPRVPQCVPECGRLVDENKFTDNEVRFPWMVRIYEKPSDTEYSRSAEGTLLSPDLVITSYQYFSRNTYVYAGGSENLDYETSSRVKNVYFCGRPTNSHSIGDVVILCLETPFTMSPLVRPVCIDWSPKTTNVNHQLEKNLVLLIPKETDKNPSVPPYYMDRNPTHVSTVKSCNKLFTLRGLRTQEVPLRFTTELGPGPAETGQAMLYESNGIWYLNGVKVFLTYHVIWDKLYDSIHTHLSVVPYVLQIRSVFMQSAISAPMVDQSLA